MPDVGSTSQSLRESGKRSWSILQERSATADSELAELMTTFDSLFQSTRDTHFEDGMDSAFTQDLTATILRGGIPALIVLEELIFSSRTSTDSAVETLRLLGSINHAESIDKRRQMLEKG